MTTRARSSILSYFKPGDEPTLDDRGRPFTMAPNELITPLLWKRTPFSVWFSSHSFILILMVMAVLMYFSDYPSSITWSSLYPLSFGFIFSIFWRARIYNSPLRRHSTLTALLIAYRRCGACAYDLHDVNPDAEGFITCPECGASWHHSRCTRADRDYREDPRLKALVANPYKYIHPGAIDHRTLPLANVICWPLRWLVEADTSDYVLRGMLAYVAERKRRFRAIALPSALTLLISGVSLIAWYKDEHETRDYIIIAIVCSLIVAVLYYAFWRWWTDYFALSAASDRFNACNHCGQALPNTPPEFDGCRVCAKCGAAWKAGTTPIPEPDIAAT